MNNHDERLVDIRRVRINQSLPQEEKPLAYVHSIRNPYLYKCGEVKITAVFDNSGPSMSQCMGEVSYSL